MRIVTPPCSGKTSIYNSLWRIATGKLAQIGSESVPALTVLGISALLIIMAARTAHHYAAPEKAFNANTLAKTYGGNQ